MKYVVTALLALTLSAQFALAASKPVDKKPPPDAKAKSTTSSGRTGSRGGVTQ